MNPKRDPQGPRSNSKSSRIIAFANHKGGAKKTTTTVQTAFILAERGYRTLVVDLDPQSNCTECLTGRAAGEDRDLHSVLSLFAPDTNPRLHVRENIDLVPCNPYMTDRYVASCFTDFPRLPDDDVRAEMSDVIRSVGGRLPDETWDGLHHAVRCLAEEYDVCLIDCPPTLGIHTELALSTAHEVVVTVSPTTFMARGYTLIGNMIGRLRANAQLAARYEHSPIDVRMTGILITDYDARPNLYQSMEAAIRSDAGPLVFDTVIRHTVDVAGAMMLGQPVAEFRRGSNAAEDYDAFVTELLNRGQ